jgi:HPt (histidine-containing phosphotransfer) domain-containing protein
MTGSNPQSKAEATLTALRIRFRSESWRMVDIFRRLAEELQADPHVLEVIERLKREAHRVHGTAGSYGFRRASTMAALLEERATAWIADPALERADRGVAVGQFARELERSFAEEV